jgi:hypothetical protein
MALGAEETCFEPTTIGQLRKLLKIYWPFVKVYRICSTQSNNEDVVEDEYLNGHAWLAANFVLC